MSTYEFTVEDYWTNNGCDCCEDTKWTVYNCPEVSGSCNDLEDAYATVIAEHVHELELADLEALAEKLGLEITFDYSGCERG